MHKMFRKFLYRNKIVIACFNSLAVVVFTLLYLTGPRSSKDPSIRVLFISHSNHRILAAIEAESSSSLISTISTSSDGSIILERSDWGLSLPDTSTATGEFYQYYQNNIVLECTAPYPIYWSYKGYGSPFVSEESYRKVGNLNDSNTYTFSSLLNLTPLKEETTGRFICSGFGPLLSNFNKADNNGYAMSSFIHVFIPGNRTFIIQNDERIQSHAKNELFIPCPVSNTRTNVSLFFMGEMVGKDMIKNYNPERGFTLNPKFLEEVADPWGMYYCQDGDGKRSGNIYVTPKKESTVRVIPAESIISFDKEKFDGVFKCEAKENITIKFRRVKNSRKVSYRLNASSDYPYNAWVKFNKVDLRDGTMISCKTVRKSSFEELHTWKVVLAESESRLKYRPMPAECIYDNDLFKETLETPYLYYKRESDEYVCCGGKTAPKFRILSCLSYGECIVKRECFESKLCGVTPSKLVEKSGCLHYKVEYRQNISSGLIECSSETSMVRMHFDSADRKIHELLYLEPTFMSSNASLLWSLLTLTELFVRRTGSGLKLRYHCQGPRFYFAGGFLWQIVRFNGVSDIYNGIERILKEIKWYLEYFEGPWINNFIELDTQFLDGEMQAKKVYCLAPVWNSPFEWMYNFKHIHYGLP